MVDFDFEVNIIFLAHNSKSDTYVCEKQKPEQIQNKYELLTVID